jgi:hypothetical protein
MGVLRALCFAREEIPRIVQLSCAKGHLDRAIPFLDAPWVAAAADLPHSPAPL